MGIDLCAVMKNTVHPRAFALSLAVAVLAGAAIGVGLLGETAIPGSFEAAAAAQSQTELAKASIPAAAIIEPEDLARTLQSPSGEKPLIFQIGFRVLYKSAHILGAEYLGPASKDEGLEQLRRRVALLARGKSIVLYCGCCPWVHCPNVKPAYEALRTLGFTQVKVLRIEENFGANWVAKGYPTAKGA
jgi:thiosulfate/3-mercaptopyruvate sulfurtransferase